METKALEQLHFKYYGEVKETQNVRGRQVPRCLWPLEEVCLLSRFTRLRQLDCSVCSSLVYPVTDVRFICLLMSFSATPSWSAYGLRGRAEGSSLFFYGEPFLVHNHCCLTEAGPK